MKVVKVLLALAVTVIALMVIVVVLAFTGIDKAAKIGIEQGAGYALGVDTTLASADIGLFSGRFAMSGLNVANPEGFSTPHFFSLGSGEVKVSYSSLASETVTLPSLTLSSIDVYLDKEEGTSNYQTILDNLKRFESGDTPPDPNADPSQPSKEFVIQSLKLSDITVHADILGSEPTALKIDSITLTNVGSGGGDPIELAGVVAIVMKSVMLAAVQAGAGALPDALIGELQSGLSGLDSLSDLGVGVAAEIGGVTEDLGSLAENISQGVFESAEDLSKGLQEGTEGIQDTLDGVGQGLQDAAGGLGGLLGGSKDDDKPKD